MQNLTKLLLAACFLCFAFTSTVALATGGCEIEIIEYQDGDDLTLKVYEGDTGTGPMVDGDEPLESIVFDSWDALGAYIAYLKTTVVGKVTVDIVK